MPDAPEPAAALANRLRQRQSPPRRFYSGSLAKPNADEYGVILAVNLIAGAFAYGLLAGVGVSLFLWPARIQPVGWSWIQELVAGSLLAGMLSLLGAAVLSGGVALLCLILVPLFDSITKSLKLTAAERRRGQALGAAVAAAVAAPAWAATWRLTYLPALCLLTLPLIVVLQVAGALAAPGDVIAWRRKRQSLSVRGLLGYTTAMAVLAALAGAGGTPLQGVAFLSALTTATHVATRGATVRTLRWLLLRRLKRRRDARLAEARGSSPA